MSIELTDTRAFRFPEMLPFYIAHQTIILLAEGALLPQGSVPRPVSVRRSAIGDGGGCCVFYAAGVQNGWLRLLIVLKAERRPSNLPAGPGGVRPAGLA